MLILVILLSVLLVGSVALNVVWFKRLTMVEVEINERDEDLFEKVVEFKKMLNNNIETIEKIAGYDVISDEPFVRRVVEAINEVHESLTMIQSELTIVEENEEPS